MMAQLDESERRQWEAAGTEGLQTTNVVAAISVEVGARQQQAAGTKDQQTTN